MNRTFVYCTSFSLMLGAVISFQPTQAQETAAASKAAIDGCVSRLALFTYPSINSPGSRYTETSLESSDTRSGDDFSTCISSATTGNPASDYLWIQDYNLSNESLDSYNVEKYLGDHPDTRYIFTDGYLRKILTDRQEYTEYIMTPSRQEGDRNAFSTSAAVPAIDQCIEKLQEMPATSSEGGHRTYARKTFEIGGQDVSAGFSKCIESARNSNATANYILFINDQTFSGQRNDMQRINDSWAHNKNLRYAFSDSYERKYLFDIKTRTEYSLVRIPPDGSIESLGYWQGTFQYPRTGCYNSKGDPCGTNYRTQRDVM